MLGDGVSGEGEGEGEGRGAAAAYAVAATPLDLTTSHIPPLVVPPDELSLYVPLGGSMVKLKGYGGSGGGKGGKRDKVTFFSAASRRRLLQRLSSVDRGAALPLFASLTYPGDDWPADPRRWHEHLESLYKRICRFFPNCRVAIIWRLEPQKRGAPHFHLLIFGVKFLPYRLLGRWWSAIVGGGDVHAARCMRVERVRSWRGVMSYASKYLGKLGAGDRFETSAGEVLDEVGRHWGVKGRANLPVTWVRYALCLREFHQLRRQVVRYMASKGREHRVRAKYAGVWCFMAADDALRLLGGIAPESDMTYEAPAL